MNHEQRQALRDSNRKNNRAYNADRRWGNCLYIEHNGMPCTMAYIERKLRRK
jgi:hypothetical protein